MDLLSPVTQISPVAVNFFGSTDGRVYCRCSLFSKAPYLSHPVSQRVQLDLLRPVPSKLGRLIDLLVEISKRRYAGMMDTFVGDIKNKE